MFGQSHFELIDLHNGEEFVPAVIYQNDLTKINDIDNKDIRPAYLNVVELTEKLKDLYKMQKENNKIINVLEESINDMSNNTDKSKEYKRAFINAISDKIENIKTELNSLKVEIQLHEADLSGQEAAIQLHEAELNDLEAAIQLHKVKLSDLEVARQLQKKEWNK
jgi:chromosome segregation ATPase